MAESAVATRRALIREIHRLPAPQVGEVLSFVRSLAGAPHDATHASEPLADGVRAVLAWAARAEAATADRLVLEEPADQGEMNEAPEMPFAIPRLSRVSTVR